MGKSCSIKRSTGNISDVAETWSLLRSRPWMAGRVNGVLTKETCRS